MKKEVIASENESPWWLIDLDVSNFEFQIFGVVAMLKKNQNKYSKFDTFKSMSYKEHLKNPFHKKILHLSSIF